MPRLNFAGRQLSLQCECRSGVFNSEYSCFVVNSYCACWRRILPGGGQLPSCQRRLSDLISEDVFIPALTQSSSVTRQGRRLVSDQIQDAAHVMSQTHRRSSALQKTQLCSETTVPLRRHLEICLGVLGLFQRDHLTRSVVASRLLSSCFTSRSEIRHQTPVSQFSVRGNNSEIQFAPRLTDLCLQSAELPMERICIISSSICITIKSRRHKILFAQLSAGEFCQNKRLTENSENVAALV